MSVVQNLTTQPTTPLSVVFYAVYLTNNKSNEGVHHEHNRIEPYRSAKTNQACNR